MNRIIVAALAVTLLAGCGADEQEAQQQYNMNVQAVQSTGMPAIHNFFERRLLKSVYELRDQAKPTTTYIVDLNGHLHKLCDSVGYGIPYSTQYSNPTNREPNSLYPPSAADGTWVLCTDPHTKQSTPLYVEPRIVVSPFAIANAQ